MSDDYEFDSHYYTAIDRGYDPDDDYSYDDEDWGQYDCPPVTLREVLKKWFRQIRNKLSNLIHRDEDVSEIPF